MSGSVSVNPYSFVNAINDNRDIIRNDPRPDFMVQYYNPFLTNKTLSWYMDTVLFANEMNKYPTLDKDMQFAYLLNTIRKKRRYSKKINIEEDENLELICNYYNVNKRVGIEYLQIMSSEDIDGIKNRLYKGGVEK
jgi:hypothetical protein